MDLIFPFDVKGGVKLDHYGGGKVDQHVGSWGFGLRDLRGRLERKPALQIGAVNLPRVARSVVFRDAAACCP